MPRKTTPKKKDISKDDHNSLLEFEQFVAQKPIAKSKNKVWLFPTLFIILALAALLFYVANFNNSTKEYKFKAVYLDNDQVYYAKIVKEDALNIYLDNVYYIQLEERQIPIAEDSEELQTVSVPVLVKRGDELHKPAGLLQLNRDKVIAIEEIGADSDILKEIEKLQ